MVSMFLAFVTGFVVSLIILLLILHFNPKTFQGPPGAPGPQGPAGTRSTMPPILHLRGVLTSTAYLPHHTASDGDVYVVDGRVYVFIETYGSFTDAGPVVQRRL